MNKYLKIIWTYFVLVLSINAVLKVLFGFNMLRDLIICVVTFYVLGKDMEELQ